MKLKNCDFFYFLNLTIKKHDYKIQKNSEEIDLLKNVRAQFYPVEHKTKTTTTKIHIDHWMTKWPH